MFLPVLDEGWLHANVILRIGFAEDEEHPGLHPVTYQIAGEVRTAYATAHHVQAFLGRFKRTVPIKPAKENAV